jgi:hypothetical protein
MNEPLNELAAALVAAQAEFAAIPKTAENPFFKSKYADLATVISHTQPILARHGLAVSQHPTTLDGEPALTTWVLHSSGQSMRDTMKLYAAKNDPQGQGAAITYARRFAYMAVLGLVADADDDGNQATQARRAEPKAKPLPTHVAKLAAVAKKYGLDTKVLGQRFENDYGLPVMEADPQTVLAFAQMVADEAEIDIQRELEQAADV